MIEFQIQITLLSKMGNACENVTCCKNMEKTNQELMMEQRLETSSHSRYEQLVKTKESMVEMPTENKNEKNVIYFENGCTYEGDWDPVKKRHGFGVYVWNDGSKYTGYWMNNAANGFGKLEHEDGETYEGNWLNDKAHGYGEFRSKEGTVYKGEWREDLQHGQGLEIWSNLASYEGEYAYGKKCGRGILKFSDGACYDVF